MLKIKMAQKNFSDVSDSVKLHLPSSSTAKKYGVINCDDEDDDVVRFVKVCL